MDYFRLFLPGCLKLLNGKCVEILTATYVLIYAADGKLVSKETMQASRYTKDVSRLSAGIYVVQVWQQGRASVKKVYIGNR